MCREGRRQDWWKLPGCLQSGQPPPENPLVCHWGCLGRRGPQRQACLMQRGDGEIYFLKAKPPSLSPTVHQCVEVRATIHSLFAPARKGRLSGSEVRARLFPKSPVSVCADSMESFQAMMVWHPLLASRKIHGMARNGQLHLPVEGQAFWGSCPLCGQSIQKTIEAQYLLAQSQAECKDNPQSKEREGRGTTPFSRKALQGQRYPSLN